MVIITIYLNVNTTAHTIGFTEFGKNSGILKLDGPDFQEWTINISSSMVNESLEEAFLELGKGLKWYYSLNNETFEKP